MMRAIYALLLKERDDQIKRQHSTSRSLTGGGEGRRVGVFAMVARQVQQIRR